MVACAFVLLSMTAHNSRRHPTEDLFPTIASVNRAAVAYSCLPYRYSSQTAFFAYSEEFFLRVSAAGFEGRQVKVRQKEHTREGQG